MITDLNFSSIVFNFEKSDIIVYDFDINFGL